MKTGSSLIGLLLVMLIGALIYLQMGPMVPQVATPGNPALGGGSPVDQAWAATCLANKAGIQTAVQMYNISHPPMKDLDMNSLGGGVRLPDPKSGCPCKYSLSANGNVVCSFHK